MTNKTNYNWRQPCTQGVVCNRCGYLNAPDGNEVFYRKLPFSVPSISCGNCDEEIDFTFAGGEDGRPDAWQTLGGAGMRPLIEVINEQHAALKRTIDQYVPLLTEARRANDPLSQAVQIHEVLRQLSTVSKRYADSLKSAVTEQMCTDGEYKAECGPYVVSLRKGSTRAVVTDTEALQRVAPELFQPQPPKCDTAELNRLLKFRPVEGATLVEGAPTITVRGNTK